MMEKIKDYMQLAIEKNNLNGINHLAKEIGLKGPTLSNFNTEKAIPSNETMVKIAKLAGVDKEQALLDVEVLRIKRNIQNSNDETYKNFWTNMLKTAGKFSMVLVLLGLSTTPCLSKEISQSVGYSSYTLCDKYVLEVYVCEAP